MVIYSLSNRLVYSSRDGRQIRYMNLEYFPQISTNFSSSVFLSALCLTLSLSVLNLKSNEARGASEKVGGICVVSLFGYLITIHVLETIKRLHQFRLHGS